MTKTPIFKGSCTAIVTPFCKSGIDFERFSELMDFQYDNGTKALVVCGTTGENATMSAYEHEASSIVCDNQFPTPAYFCKTIRK